MKKRFQQALAAMPITLAALFFPGYAMAAGGQTMLEESVQTQSVQTQSVQLAQVTGVSELSDVQPGDWAFTALQRLVEEYGCLEGYPDRSFRGDRPLSRYEFAAGLNACLDVVAQVLSPNYEFEEDTRRLFEEFVAEIHEVRNRVDSAEASIATLEANQFSTTTKLNGELDAHLVVPFGEADVNNVAVSEADTTFEYRARLNFDTSFTGEDRLRVRLQASDDAGALANTRTGAADGGLASQSSPSGANDNVQLDDVYYNFPVGDRISGTIAANSVLTDDFVTSTIVPFDGPSVADAGGPEFYDLYPGGDFGAGVNVAITDNLVLDLGYSSGASNVNTGGSGLFNDNSYIAQMNLLTDGVVDAAIAYIGTDNSTAGTAENTLAGLVNFDLGRVQVGGHYAATQANGGGDLDSYGGGLAIADLFGAGNNFGIYGGVQPSLDTDPLLVEAYYEMNVNDFFSITPAVVYTDNDTTGETDNVYGALRTSFKF